MAGQENNSRKGDLLEYSVVYTDRAVNLMSSPFQQVMRDISSTLKSVYKAHHVALIPGSGTYAMEAVARQFGQEKKCLVIRNGFFSYRWSDIFSVCSIPSEEVVLKAQAASPGSATSAFAPMPIDQVVQRIHAEKPAAVFAPHVETATGILLPNDYLQAVAAATHAVGGIFVLDCIASGTLWVDMEATGVDVLVSAPQKGWSGPACCGIVLLNDKALGVAKEVRPSSFSCNLPKWLEVMKKYEDGAFMYYTTLPTDALTTFRDVMQETEQFGWENARQRAVELGTRVRKILEEKNINSVAADEFKSPTVVVSYVDVENVVGKFKQEKIQVAGPVPFMCDEPQGLKTFRVGLFGIDKLKDVDRTVEIFEKAVNKIVA